MIIGLAKEIKKGEYRVAMSPMGVAEIVNAGHDFLVEKDAGVQIGIANAEYEKVGAKIVTRKKLVDNAEMIVKVKELQVEEFNMLGQGQILFSYLHLAPDLAQTKALLKNKVTGVAFETVTARDGSLPLLTPMSEVAGKMAIQQGAYFLTKPQGGSGVLLGGVPGTQKGNVVIIGGGVVGTNAAKIAIGMGANVTIVDKSLPRLRYLEEIFAGRLTVAYSTDGLIQELIQTADIVVGAVLIPGASAPRVITKKMLKTMKPGSVLVDVAIDQGGCFETSKATFHFDPVYTVDGIIHYCVSNIPGAVAQTSSKALEAAILPYVKTIANKGIVQAALDDTGILNGLNTLDGKIVFKAIADGFGMKYHDPIKLLKQY
ncbi:alanine dehydrogenase [Candidatus Deianiraea vastatrix]|uniref:Alanine dehydrogenase n=1 Tax=Candidatus Deianiraea vastatrix TaxID=2163644 RepID=A0A5B8XF35_9RICK|nr:alanine dehydrogenase [Candidatus Deianiraea vastatrix]QED23928.1 Alanine dehydrogenase [Candidatus Deianiraea vastatrix]